MGSQVKINRWTGPSGSPTKTDIRGLNTRIDNQDAHSTADTAHPVYAGLASFWCVTRLECVVAPLTLIDNLQWAVPVGSSLGFDITLKIGRATTYIQATPGPFTGGGTPLDHGVYTSLINLGGGFYTTNGLAADFTFPFPLDGSAPPTGDFGDFLVSQIVVGTSANPGVSGHVYAYWSYDET